MTVADPFDANPIGLANAADSVLEGLRKVAKQRGEPWPYNPIPEALPLSVYTNEQLEAATVYLIRLGLLESV